ncbi:histidine kinase [Enterobacter hormaechei subsp. hoffmannii]|nr:histidine kinase [Enterobacter hormaechei subsp. hoffmannii]
MNEALKLLNSGAADGIVCDAALADILVHNLYPGLLLSRDLPAISSNQVFWVLPGQEKLLKQINESIDALPPGVASSIITRWLLNSALNEIHSSGEQRNPYIDSFVTIGGSILLLLVAFLLSQILRRQRAERGLLDALSYWQTLLNSIPTPLLVCNPVGKITHCNQKLLASLQVEAHQVIGTTLSSLMAQYPVHPPLEHPEWVSAVTTDIPRFTDRTLRIHERTFEIIHWLTAYRDSRGIPQGLLVGWYDISERKRLERELEKSSLMAMNASKEKSEFLARMSHEIRSPMNAILGILELEQQKQELPADSALNVAYAASRQLLQIVGGVLDLSKIEAGQIKLQIQPRALYPLLKQVVETYATLARKKGLQLESALESVAGNHYQLDGTKLSQIVSNLLSNAIKYTEQGRINISVDREAVSEDTDRLIFSVQDTGPGIAADMQERILQPYIQLDPDSPDSSGLGLAICTQFLKLMGSTLQIDSEPDTGSRFTFALCLKKAAASASEEENTELNLPRKSLDILVVDDNTPNLVVMTLQLETLGHRVTTCDDGKYALQQLQEKTFDILLTDCQMPLMDGYQLARHQRQREAAEGGYLVIIGCTANAFSDEQQRCLEAGMDAVLIKPLTLQDLRQVLSEQQMSLDMEELKAMAAGNPDVMAILVNELISSSENDRLQMLNLSQEETEQVSAIVHRQKGSFAIAGFLPGIALCEKMEKLKAVNDEPGDVSLLRIQFNTLVLRFHFLLNEWIKGRECHLDSDQKQ